MGNRYSAYTDETTTLEFEFRKNSILTNAYSVNKVTLHATSNDATNDANIIETITTITNTATGLYKYTAALISTAGTYYDKVFVTPINGASEVSYINSFTVAAPTFAGAALSVPSNPNLCRIYGKTVDSNGNILRGVVVFCRPYAMPGTIQNSFLGQDGVDTASNTYGEFYLDLYKNTEFIITIKEMGVHATITVPDASIFPIISLIAGESVTPPSNPGDTTW